MKRAYTIFDGKPHHYVKITRREGGGVITIKYLIVKAVGQHVFREKKY